MNKTPLQQYIVRRPSVAEALALAEVPDTHKLTALARQLRDHGHGNIISYSRKIFIPLTKLCRDFCHYCTFAEAPLKDSRNFMTPEEVLELVRQGEAAGCKEVLFTLGDKPELRYREAREELATLGHQSTLSYLAEIAEMVLAESNPHRSFRILPTKAGNTRKQPNGIDPGISGHILSPRRDIFRHFPDRIAIRIEISVIKDQEAIGTRRSLPERI